MKAYSALDRFRPGSPFRPWLLRIVANETRNLHRSRTRRRARELGWVSPATAPDPESEAVGSVRRAELIAAIGALPAELRDVVTCRYLLELSEAEAAVTLNVPAGTVKSRLHRALSRLRLEVSDESRT